MSVEMSCHSRSGSEAAGCARHLSVAHRVTGVLLVALALGLACGEKDELLGRAESGDPEAQLALGNRYAAPGDGQDTRVALQWFEKSAQQGFVDSQVRLAQIYTGTEGFQEDLRRGPWVRAVAARIEFSGRTMP